MIKENSYNPLTSKYPTLGPCHFQIVWICVCESQSLIMS